MGHIKSHVQQLYLAGERPSQDLTFAESVANLAQDAGNLATTAWYVTLAIAKATGIVYEPVAQEAYIESADDSTL